MLITQVLLEMADLKVEILASSIVQYHEKFENYEAQLIASNFGIS